jgi:N utilization substance protein A
VESFDEEIAEELRRRAMKYVEKINSQMAEKRVALGVQDELAEIEGLSPVALVILGQADIKSLDDLGDLAGDELVEILGDIAPSLDDANAIIMAARAHWFDDEPAETEAGEASEGETADGETADGEASGAAATEDESAALGEETGSP